MYKIKSHWLKLRKYKNRLWSKDAPSFFSSVISCLISLESRNYKLSNAPKTHLDSPTERVKRSRQTTHFTVTLWSHWLNKSMFLSKSFTKAYPIVAENGRFEVLTWHRHQQIICHSLPLILRITVMYDSYKCSRNQAKQMNLFKNSECSQ